MTRPRAAAVPAPPVALSGTSADTTTAPMRMTPFSHSEAVAALRARTDAS